MNQGPEQRPPFIKFKSWQFVLGIIFSIGWLAACGVVGFILLFMESLSENGTGAMQAGYGFYIFTSQFFGFHAVAIAGCLGAAAIYTPSHRKRLLCLFVALLVVGLLMIYIPYNLFSELHLAIVVVNQAVQS